MLFDSVRYWAYNTCMEEEKRKQKYTAVIVGMVTSFATAFSGSALNLAVPEMGSYFHLGAASVGWLITIYTLVLAGFSVPFGKLGDSTGRKRLLVLGIIVFTAGSFLAVYTRTAAAILIMRAVMGVGAAMIFATNMPIAISAYPSRQRGQIIGLVTAGVYTGLSLGPVLGGILTSRFGWKSIFLFSAAISFFSLVLVLTGLPREKNLRRVPSSSARQDTAGNMLFVLMITGVIYGFSNLTESAFSWLFLAAGIAFGVLFCRHELRCDEPTIDVRVFARNRTYTLSNLAALFNYCATFALGYLTSIYLQVVVGMSAQRAGLLLITQPVCMAVLTPGMGKLSDRVSPYKLASGGMGLCAASLASFLLIGQGTSMGQVIAALALAGVGIGLFSSPNTNVIMSCVKPQSYGVANTVLATMRTAGQSLGMAIVTIVANISVGNSSLYDLEPEALVRMMHICFAVFTILCLVGIFMSLERRRDAKI